MKPTWCTLLALPSTMPQWHQAHWACVCSRHVIKDHWLSKSAWFQSNWESQVHKCQLDMAVGTLMSYNSRCYHSCSYSNPTCPCIYQSMCAPKSAHHCLHTCNNHGYKKCKPCTWLRLTWHYFKLLLCINADQFQLSRLCHSFSMSLHHITMINANTLTANLDDFPSMEGVSWKLYYSTIFDLKIGES